MLPGTKSANFRNTAFLSHFYSPEEENIYNKLSKVFEDNTIVFEVIQDNSTYIISAVPLHENEGKISKILTASQNITEQKRNEVEKERLIGQLMQTNSDLQQFSYITSHNLRAPLSNISGLINLIDISSVADAITATLLKSLEECTLQLNDTVNDLINILIIKNNIHSEKEKIDIR